MRFIRLRSAAFAVVVGCAAALSVPAAHGDMVDFEDLPTGTLFAAGTSFTSGGVEITLTGGSAEVGDDGLAGGAGNELEQFGGGLFLFDFGGVVTGIGLLYGTFGGAVNLEINGEFLSVGDINDLSGIVGDVDVFVHGPDVGSGYVKFEGHINSFAIGGEEFAIDSIRYFSVPGPGALIALCAGMGVMTGPRRRRRRA